MSNYSRIIRYFKIKNIVCTDISKFIDNFEDHYIKNTVQIVVKNLKTCNFVNTFENIAGYTNTKYVIILNKSITFVPHECSLTELYKLLDKLYNGYINEFKNCCSMCCNELEVAKKCCNCNVLYCYECYDKFTNKNNFCCVYCKENTDMKNKTLHYIEIKNKMLVSF